MGRRKLKKYLTNKFFHVIINTEKRKGKNKMFDMEQYSDYTYEAAMEALFEDWDCSEEVCEEVE